MYISFHGGMCCGIKHIYELGQYPGATVSAKPATSAEHNDVMYTYSLPSESAEERLDRYLKFLRDRRPHGIVEISLAKSRNKWVDQGRWEPVLLERGFKEVTPKGGVYNSNSGNRVRIFHLYVDKED